MRLQPTTLVGAKLSLLKTLIHLYWIGPKLYLQPTIFPNYEGFSEQKGFHLMPKASVFALEPMH